MVTPTMRTEFASQYLWDPPVQTLMALALLIRPRVDLLIAITHIGISQDRHLAERAPQIDIILGGHSHTVLQEPEKIGKTYICQGGSHNRFAGLYQWDASRLTGELVPL